MSLILCIETSTTVCSVAIAKESNCIAFNRSDTGNAHSVVLTPLIEKTLKEASIDPSMLSAVAVSDGPGSYTGLRIGVSVTKGLCYSLNIPAITISSLKIIAANALNKIDPKDKDALICPLMDARRMEVYSALYSINLKEVKKIKAEIIDEKSYSHTNNKIYFAGNGVDKCREVIQSRDVFFLTGIDPLASSMCRLATEKYDNKQFADVAYFEPFYLKNFIATHSKKSILKT
ncbi:tRNA (adenosine(37)-N6)-threonylcarbamoyltransferase complex dimerization subunit type 1 TsaB [Marinilabiliaceae bacterium ANBcel2]|nr:tRNA (adenosine(37)-N6)-threonylcarbamoyltransferase complex dimerization subunit type 1 TsaB [Marinilabiliaceae bacterium ANBcel2]